MGMLRFKDQKEFDTLLKGSHLKVRSDTTVAGRAFGAGPRLLVSLRTFRCEPLSRVSNSFWSLNRSMPMLHLLRRWRR